MLFTDLVSLIETVDKRYSDSVFNAAHSLGERLYIPSIFAFIEGSSSTTAKSSVIDVVVSMSG